MARKIKLKFNAKLIKKKAKKNLISSSKRCRFCADEKLKVTIDYKNSSLLKSFLIDCGKILPSRISGNCHACQKRVTSAIKFSRAMALIPFCAH
jgi:small subunit ribosomal protein S18